MYASRSGPGFSRCDVPLLYIRYKVEVDAKAEGLSYPFPRRPGCPVERGMRLLPYIIYKVEVDAEAEVCRIRFRGGRDVRLSAV